MLPAITKLLPHLPRVFRNKSHAKSVSSEQTVASDIVHSSTGKHFRFQVILLDSSELTLFAKPSGKAKTLIDQVIDHVGIVEKEYFGLCVRDETNKNQWLDLQKTLGSQLNGKESYTVYLAVKFYAADPCKLFQEITRYQFFLQVKQDIMEGRLPVPNHIAAELAAYALQSELGDYDPSQHLPGYSSEFVFIPNQTERFERRVETLHRRHVGLLPARAEYNYLDRVKWLDMYGVDLHPVQGDGAVDYLFGIAPTGIVIYRNKVKICNHFWPRLVKVSCKGTQLILRVRDRDNIERTYSFYCMTKHACKQLQQSCSEHHQFFRTNAASYSYQTTIKLFAADAKLRSNSRTTSNEQDTPTFARRSSLRRRQQTSHTGSMNIARHHSFMSLPPDSSTSACCQNGRESPMSVRSAACTRRSYACSESGCTTSRKRHRRNCCTDVSDAESHMSFASSHRRRDCESCCQNKSMRSLSRSRWSNCECGYTDSESIAGSVSSMVSAPEWHSHRHARHRRRRRRLPPEELAQHFRYVDPADAGIDVGVTDERIQSLPYTCVKTNVPDSDLRISPRTWQRLRQRQQKIYATQQSVPVTRRAWVHETEIPAFITDAEKRSLGSRQANPRISSNSSTCVVPSQYLQLPISVQMTEMFTAPIVKIKRNDGKPLQPDDRLTNRSSLSSSSSTSTDLYDVQQGMAR